MEYKYCQKTNFEDFACGRVIYQKSGMTNFPVRLSQELFGRCLNYLKNKDNICLYDPCCGSGYLLTVLGLLNFNIITEIIASDINIDALNIAKDNLSLLSKDGLEKRYKQLALLYKQYQKTSHLEAIDSTKRLYNMVEMNSSKPITHVFQADVLSKDSLIHKEFKANIIITDVPYGNKVSWQGSNSNDLNQLLENLIPILNIDSVIAVCSDKKQKINADKFIRLEKQLIGNRKFEIFKYIKLT